MFFVILYNSILALEVGDFPNFERLTMSTKKLGRECLSAPARRHFENTSKQNTYD
jgi:hypothetical protein